MKRKQLKPSLNQASVPCNLRTTCGTWVLDSTLPSSSIRTLSRILWSPAHQLRFSTSTLHKSPLPPLEQPIMTQIIVENGRSDHRPTQETRSVVCTCRSREVVAVRKAVGSPWRVPTRNQFRGFHEFTLDSALKVAYFLTAHIP